MMPLPLATLTETLLFYGVAAVTAASAMTVVFSRNVVRMAVALLFTLAAIAALFFLLQAEFLAAVQLVIYIGGTLILIVFGIMLTSKSPHTRFEPRRVEIVLATVMAATLLATLLLALPTRPALVGAAARVSPAEEIAPSQASGRPLQPMASLGAALLGDYLLPFELVSVLLLAVMIGAAYLARGRR